jgi:hypothetical protein
MDDNQTADPFDPHTHTHKERSHFLLMSARTMILEAGS